MYWPCEEKKTTIEDIYKYCQENNLKMLSNYQGDFWKPYRDNSDLFDRQFMRRYKTFFPYIQEDGQEPGDVAVDFVYDVVAHLTTHDKKYSELFRVWTIEDNEAYSLTNNVDYTESYEETYGRGETFTKGEQTDTEDLSATKGEQTDTEDLSATKGEQTDTEDLSATKGEQTDTEDLSTTFGAQDVDTTASTSAYNASSFANVDKTEVENGSHEDTQDNSRTSGERTDTQDNSRTYGERTDTQDNSRTSGERTDTEDNSRTYGTREDSTEEEGSKNYTSHKVGNMGVQTVDDMLKRHWDNWNVFSFYDYVFSEIANDLLRGVI